MAQTTAKFILQGGEDTKSSIISTKFLTDANREMTDETET